MWHDVEEDLRGMKGLSRGGRYGMEEVERDNDGTQQGDTYIRTTWERLRAVSIGMVGGISPYIIM